MHGNSVFPIHAELGNGKGDVTNSMWFSMLFSEQVFVLHREQPGPLSQIYQK